MMMETDGFFDYEPEFEVRPIPPLQRGDEFMVNADFRQDALDLGAIYGIADTDFLGRCLSETDRSTVLDSELLASILCCNKVDADEFMMSHFLRDCRRSIIAVEELWRD